MKNRRIWLLTLPFVVLIASLFSLPKKQAGAEERDAVQTAAPISSLSGHSPIQSYVLRLRPGQDLKRELDAFVKQNHIKAGCIVTCVGSLKQANLRYANKPKGTTLTNKFEIVSLVGTLEPDGGHLHISLSDGKGKTIGGHLLEGNLIYTTAEIVLGDLTELVFEREQEPLSGYKELVIRKR
jgi:predicted DNA-binding protein with PD1-like motif